MRGTRLIACAAAGVLVGFAAAGAAPTGWHEPGAPEGGDVYALERGPDGTVYAGTAAGLFTSRDGSSWQRAGRFDGVSDEAAVVALDAPSASTVYAVTGGSVFKSIDDGATWQRVRDGSSLKIEFMSVAAAHGDPDVVFAGAGSPVANPENPGVIYRSSDGGRTWSQTTYGADEGAAPVVITVDPTSADTIYVGAVNGEMNGLDGQSGGVYKSENGGASYTPLSIGLPLKTTILTVAVDPVDHRTVYAGTSASGVFKTTDGGLRWRRARTGLPVDEGTYASVNDLVSDQGEPGVFYAATDSGMAASVDAGASWHAQTGDGVPALSSLASDPAAPGTLLAGSAGAGIFRTTNRGASWDTANTGLTALRTMAIAVDPASPETVYVGTYEGGLRITTDGGRHWSRAEGISVPTVRAIAIDPKALRTVYVGTDEQGVLKSVDGGKTWNPSARGIVDYATISALAVDPSRPQTVYALDYGSAIYKTVNGGASWVKRTPQLSEAPYAIALDPAHPATIYAGSEVIEGRKWLIARSGNGGRTWQPLSAGLRRSASEVRAIGVARKTGATYAAVNQETQGGYAGDAVYRLARGGKRWTPIARGLPRGSDDRPAEIRSLAVDPRTGSVRVGTNLGLYGLVRSQGALRWQLVDPSLAGLTMRRLAYAADGSRLYAATPNRFLVSP